VDRIDADAAAQEDCHDLRSLDQCLIGAMGAHPGSGVPDHLGPALRVVPVPVRDPEFPQGGAVDGEKRLDLGPDALRRINQNGLLPRGVDEQVGVGLDRTRGQDVQLHRRQRL